MCFLFNIIVFTFNTNTLEHERNVLPCFQGATHIPEGQQVPLDRSSRYCPTYFSHLIFLLMEFSSRSHPLFKLLQLSIIDASDDCQLLERCKSLDNKQQKQ